MKKDNTEITPESFINDLCDETGLTKEELTEKIIENSKLPERCPCCFRSADFTDKIIRDGEEYETDAWFCNYCGGLVKWK